MQCCTVPGPKQYFYVRPRDAAAYHSKECVGVAWRLRSVRLRCGAWCTYHKQSVANAALPSPPSIVRHIISTSFKSGWLGTFSLLIRGVTYGIEVSI